jgi:hypothetical protein
MNRINRKLSSQDSLAFAAISLTLLIITTRNKDDFSSYFKHKHCSLSNKYVVINNFVTTETKTKHFEIIVIFRIY